MCKCKNKCDCKPIQLTSGTKGEKGDQGIQGPPGVYQAPTLEQVLVVGNATDGNNILVNNADAIELENGSLLKKGTYDFGGGGGISQICSVGYEDNWQSGIRHVFDNNGFIRESSNCFSIIPDNTFDDTLRFKVGSRWVLDNGDVYLCSDASTGAAVWGLANVTANVTLQQVLDNNHDLVNGNNFQGTSAGSGATSVNQSNFFGGQAGYNATSASDSNFLGAGAGLNATGAYDSNFLGNASGSNATNAFQSNFLGVNAGHDAAFASNSNFFGVSAGITAVNAENSNFFGYASGASATDAYQSNFFGAYAGYTSSTANDCNFLGWYAGSSSSGYNVNALGYEACLNNTGNNVNGLGYNAASNNLGNDVNALGYYAASANEGNNVIAIGTSAGAGNTLSGMFIIANTELPSYANHAAASAAISPTGIAGNTYIYHNQATDSIGAVRL
jgi:hypothetical protein